MNSLSPNWSHGLCNGGHQNFSPESATLWLCDFRETLLPLWTQSPHLCCYISPKRRFYEIPKMWQYTVAKVNILLLLLEFVCQVCQLGVLSELCKKVENQVFKAGNQPDPGLGNVHWSSQCVLPGGLGIPVFNIKSWDSCICLRMCIKGCLLHQAW